MSASATSTHTTISTASAPITLMGVTGNTGGHAVNILLRHKCDHGSSIFIRGIVRSQVKGEVWKAKLSEKFGAEKVNKQVTFAVADHENTSQLTAAFTGSSSVYVMLSPGFADAAYEEPKKRVSIITDALKAAKVTRVVGLSSIAAHFTLDELHTGAIYQSHILEKALVKELGSTATITLVRAGGFFENAQRGEFPQARNGGKFATFYSQLDLKFPHVSAKDIGREIACRLVERTGRRSPLYVELEGPERYSINDFAAVYSKVFGREVVPFVIPQSQWTTILESVGIPKGRTHNLENMYTNLNAGKIVWENKPENGTVSVKGATTLEEGITELAKTWEVQQAAGTEAQAH